jgi:hypothetical protein
LKFIDALFISINIGIFNGIAWLVIIYSEFIEKASIVEFIGLIIVLGIIGLILVLPSLFNWYTKQFNNVRKAKLHEFNEEKGSFNEPEIFLSSIQKAVSFLKPVSIQFTSHRVLVTDKKIEPNMNAILNQEFIINQIYYRDVYYLRFKLALLDNKLQIKYRNKILTFYCNRNEMINARRVLDDYIEPLIVM